MEIEKLLTKKQIAERYGFCTRTVNELMRRRVLPYYKISQKLVRFDPVKCDLALNHYEHRSMYDRQIQSRLNTDPARPLVQPELGL